MKSCIVPVFSDSDLKALPNCLRYLARQNVEILLVLHGPNVGVLNADVTKEFDAKIAQLDTKKRELTLVEDYMGAARVKDEIETARVERDMAVREGWKSVPEEQRQAAYKKAFANIGTEPICLREAYQEDQLFTMLQAFLPQWPSDVAHGEYSIVWPRSVATVSAQPAAVKNVTADVAGPAPGLSRNGRETELRKSRFMGIKATAKKLGVYHQDLNTDQLVEAILDKEFPAQLAAA